MSAFRLGITGAMLLSIVWVVARDALGEDVGCMVTRFIP
jgi:hypothetical protein